MRNFADREAGSIPVQTPRLYVFIGAYGSGKSEISVNMSLAQRRSHPDSKILIADMDIVNPFYRSSDCAPLLEKNGIRVISPMYAGSNVDAPVLPAEMYVVFDDEEYMGIFDIGGEDMGATVLGSLKKRIENCDTRILMAVNALRPFTSTPGQIAQMTSELATAAGFGIDGYINNTNLLEETTLDMIEEGEQMVLDAGVITGVPLVATCIMDNIDNAASFKCRAPELFRMSRCISYTY